MLFPKMASHIAQSVGKADLGLGIPCRPAGTQGTGGALPEPTCTFLWPFRYQLTQMDCHLVLALLSRLESLGSARPLRRGRPFWPGRPLGAGANKLASQRSGVIKVTFRRWHQAKRSSA